MLRVLAMCQQAGFQTSTTVNKKTKENTKRLVTGGGCYATDGTQSVDQELSQMGVHGLPWHKRSSQLIFLPSSGELTASGPNLRPRLDLWMFLFLFAIECWHDDVMVWSLGLSAEYAMIHTYQNGGLKRKWPLFDALLLL